MSKKRLNPRHKAFADEYLANGLNGTQAYLAVYKNVKKTTTAEVNAYKLLRNTKIQEYIQSKQEKIALSKQLDFEWLIDRLKFVVDNSISEGKQTREGKEVDRASMVNALKELGKLLNHYPAEKSEVTVSSPLPITFKEIPKNKSED